MIAQFALRLICGMSCMWVMMPRSQVTCGFFRIQMLVVLGLSVLAGLTASPQATVVGIEGQRASLTPFILVVLMGITAFCGSVVWTLERRRAGNAFVFVVAGLATTALITSAVRLSSGLVEEASRGIAAHWVVSEWSSALVLGAAVSGMLLGHWYLTAPTMSIAPLNRLNAFLGASAVARLILSSVTLATSLQHISGPTHGTWLALRWLAGIFGPLIVSVMVWRILKYRNTQSATGVLFVGVILVFIGDMTGSLLSRELGIPL